jgi:hypothetical protein
MGVVARKVVAHLRTGRQPSSARPRARPSGVVGRRTTIDAHAQLEDLRPARRSPADSGRGIRSPLVGKGVAERGARGLRQQGLAAARQRHDTRGQRLGDALDLDRLGTAGDLLGVVLAQRHRADVKAGARAEAEGGECLVVGQCERRGREPVGEQQEEAVAVVDLAAAVAGEEGTRAAVMLGENTRRASVAQALDDGSAVDEVGEEKRVIGHATASSTVRTAPTVCAHALSSNIPRGEVDSREAARRGRREQHGNGGCSAPQRRQQLERACPAGWAIGPPDRRRSRMPGSGQKLPLRTPSSKRTLVDEPGEHRPVQGEVAWAT